MSGMAKPNWKRTVGSMAPPAFTNEGGLSGYLPQVESPGSYLEYAKQFLRERLSKDPYTSHLNPRLSADVLEANLGQVENYCESVENEFEAQRDENGAPVWARVGERRDYPSEVRWAVEVKVLGRKASDVAKWEKPRHRSNDDVIGVAHTTVSRAVKRILKLIDLD